MNTFLPDTSFEQGRARLYHSLMSSVSHDLKTPLTCIIGALETFKRAGETLSPDKKNSLIKVALDEAYRLEALVSRALDMAKLEKNAVTEKDRSPSGGA